MAGLININSVEALLQDIGVAALPGEKLTVAPGDSVRVRASIDYMGPRLDDTFYAAIGNRFIIFDEIWVGHIPVSFALSYDWVTYLLSVDIPITEIGLAPWTPGDFDLYIKLVNNPGAGVPELSNVIEILLRAAFQNFAITGYEKV